ncbi:hypothetical protein B0H21DRAFT_742219 [Amylocystis lapponica]|nr:hypothetical protein B0H21DRAFT_742219 [Amylocystis lapponica]
MRQLSPPWTPYELPLPPKPLSSRLPAAMQTRAAPDRRRSDGQEALASGARTWYKKPRGVRDTNVASCPSAPPCQIDTTVYQAYLSRTLAPSTTWRRKARSDQYSVPIKQGTHQSQRPCNAHRVLLGETRGAPLAATGRPPMAQARTSKHVSTHREPDPPRCPARRRLDPWGMPLRHREIQRPTSPVLSRLHSVHSVRPGSSAPVRYRACARSS